MPYGVCLITAGLESPSGVKEVLETCGFEVWTPASPNSDDGHIYGSALCLLIDMPADAGVRTLRLIRDYGINTPALLIVDPGLERAFAGVQAEGLLSVLPRTADFRGLLRWLEATCRARGARRSADEPELLSA